MLSPLSRLTGLTRLVLNAHVNHVMVVDSWPDLTGLTSLHVRRIIDACALLPIMCAGWEAQLLAALAASPTRHFLQVVRLRGTSTARTAMPAVVAAAPRLPALRRMTVGRAEWTFARGAIVGRPPEHLLG